MYEVAEKNWFPAFAGMTDERCNAKLHVPPDYCHPAARRGPGLLFSGAPPFGWVSAVRCPTALPQVHW